MQPGPDAHLQPRLDHVCWVCDHLRAGAARPAQSQAPACPALAALGAPAAQVASAARHKQGSRAQAGHARAGPHRRKRRRRRAGAGVAPARQLRPGRQLQLPRQRVLGGLVCRDVEDVPGQPHRVGGPVALEERPRAAPLEQRREPLPRAGIAVGGPHQRLHLRAGAVGCAGLGAARRRPGAAGGAGRPRLQRLPPAARGARRAARRAGNPPPAPTCIRSLTMSMGVYTAPAAAGGGAGMRQPGRRSARQQPVPRRPPARRHHHAKKYYCKRRLPSTCATAPVAMSAPSPQSAGTSRLPSS
jgi:hypothetical protein